jgi:hypothetical protein
MKRIVLFAALFAAGSVLAAPAPLQRKPVPLKQAHFYGKCFHWKYGSSDGQFVFHKDGTFNNNLGTTQYHGTWRYEDGVIYTNETCNNGQSWAKYDYKVVVTTEILKKGHTFGGTTIQTNVPVEFATQPPKKD